MPLPPSQPTDLAAGVFTTIKKVYLLLFRGSCKKIPVETKSSSVVGNYHMPKNYKHEFHPFLSSMCYPLANDAVHVAAACNKNRYRNIYLDLLYRISMYIYNVYIYL